jgi:hypothetical protein
MRDIRTSGSTRGRGETVIGHSASQSVTSAYSTFAGVLVCFHCVFDRVSTVSGLCFIVFDCV